MSSDTIPLSSAVWGGHIWGREPARKVSGWIFFRTRLPAKLVLTCDSSGLQSEKPAVTILALLPGRVQQVVSAAYRCLSLSTSMILRLPWTTGIYLHNKDKRKWNQFEFCDPGEALWQRKRTRGRAELKVILDHEKEDTKATWSRGRLEGRTKGCCGRKRKWKRHNCMRQNGLELLNRGRKIEIWEWLFQITGRRIGLCEQKHGYLRQESAADMSAHDEEGATPP